RWVFTPLHPWAKGEHFLRVDGVVEDLAGNRLHQLFDFDMKDAAQNRPPPKFDRVGFKVE
ncbi:MAG: hypothetical protein WCI21_01040, partial [Alphaproteobacteria bacterium]